jgi:hypothetical protein
MSAKCHKQTCRQTRTQSAYRISIKEKSRDVCPGVSVAYFQKVLMPGAACNGSSGAGEGPYARFLSVTIPSLTTLSKRNGVVFPYSQVYEKRLVLPAHGTRDMPIWGQERAKINALVLCIHRLQANWAAVVTALRLICVKSVNSALSTPRPLYRQ